MNRMIPAPGRCPRALPWLLSLLCAAGAQAHQIWIEQDAHSAQLYLGEFADNLRETSPGLLDKFVAPKASLIKAQTEQALSLSKQAGQFVLDGHAKADESLLAEETAYPSWQQQRGTQRLRHVWIPAARWVGDFSARAPKLTLDLVPSGQRGDFQVFYQGQPLPEAKVSVVAASGWARELKADRNGRFSVALPWQSAYALEVKHSDPRPGERQLPGQAGVEHYDVALHVTTLSFSLAAGLPAPPPPAPSPATPAKQP